MSSSYEEHSTQCTHPVGSDSDSKDKANGKRKRMLGTPHRKHRLPEDIPWTAARCNRLLRTITSRIQILRRLSENNFADKTLAKKSPARRKIDFKPERDGSGRVSPDSVQNLSSRLAALPALESPTKDGDDPDWLPDDGRKPTQKTYAGKSARAKKVKIEEPSKSSSSVGAADFRSPFIKRVLGPDATKSPTSMITDTPRRLTSQKIILDPKTHAERALRTLLDSFSTILSATASCTAAPRAGTRSLREMCLRKMPDYIDFEQKFAYDNGEYEFDATETIYLQMERRPGAGRSHDLPEMVRAHAVKMIVDAFDERSWPVASLDRLLDVCERNNAVAEGQRILRSWFAKAEGRNLNRIPRLMAWSKILNCTEFFFRVLREMLVADSRAWEELNGRPGIWQELLKAMARQSTRVDAAEFLETYTVAILRFDNCMASELQVARLHDRLKRDEILQNVMALLVALCWALDEESQRPLNTTTDLILLVYRMTINVAQAGKSGLEQSSRVPGLSRGALRTMEPLLTSALVLYSLRSFRDFDPSNSSQTDPIGARLSTLVLNILVSSNQQALQSSRADIICSAAKCIAHTSQTAADRFIQELCTSLLLRSTKATTQHSICLKQSAVFAASSWADYRADKASYTFADEIERAAHQETLGECYQTTPSTAQISHAFRWEEAIGEWIAKTPSADEQGIENLSGRSEDSTGGHLENASQAYMPRASSLSPHAANVLIAARRKGFEEASEATGNQRIEDGSSSPGSSENAQSMALPCVETSLPGNTYPQSPITPHGQTSSVGQDFGCVVENHVSELDSPLQVKALKRMQTRISTVQERDRDELSATSYNEATISSDSPNTRPMESKSASESLPSLENNISCTTPLAIRTRQALPQHVDSAICVDCDELATTPVPAVPHPPLQTSTLQTSMESIAVSDKHEELDELAATPVKRIPPSTRVLRSAMKKKLSTAVVEIAETQVIPYDLLDDLAMTPARIKRLPSTKQASFRAANSSDASEYDELSATPAALRTTRSRSHQTSKTRGRINARATGTALTRQAPLKHAKTPLGVRSGNIGTAINIDKVNYKDDELIV